MDLFRNLSLRKRLSFAFLLGTGITTTLAFLGFTSIVLIYSTRSFVQEITSVAKILASTSRAALAFHDKEAGQRVLFALQAKQDIPFAALVDNSKQLLSSYGQNTIDKEQLSEYLSRNRTWSLKQLVVTQPVLLDGEQIGSIVVVASFGSLASQLFLISIIGAAIAVVISFASILFFIKMNNWVSEPIEAIRQLASKVSQTKDLSGRLEVTREDEVNHLIRAFNQMLYELGERDRSLLQAKERAESADRAKSIFVASISHELRTPLHSILGLTSEVLSTPLNDEQLHLVHTMKSSGDLLLSIINDILDFSKIEAGKLVLAPSTFDVRRFVDKTIQIFRIPFSSKSVELSYEVHTEVPHLVITDEGKLSQILVNLIGNALKFTPAGGRVHVSLEREKSFENTTMLKFKVTDTGIGIAEKHLKLIFEPYMQAHSLQQSVEGSGLGLAISMQLIKLMGGTIWATSTPNTGSQFHFVIECSAEPDKTTIEEERRATIALTVEPSESTAYGKFTILVAEDNMVNQQLVVRMLKKKGYDVIAASNGIECVELFKQNKVDLILMDINMPEMDGFEAARHIRLLDSKTGKRVPIIAASASLADDHATESLSESMDGFIVKPFSMEKLYEVLANFLESSTQPHV